MRRVIAWIGIAFLVGVGVLLVLTFVFGLPMGAVFVVPLFLAAVIWGSFTSVFDWHDDFDGQIATSRIVDASGMLDYCTFLVVRLPETAQATPFARAPADKDWVPENATREDWQPAAEVDFFAGFSDDKIGDSCGVSSDAVALMAAAQSAPDGWGMDHSTDLYRAYLYSASARVAAWVVMDR